MLIVSLVKSTLLILTLFLVGFSVSSYNVQAQSLSSDALLHAYAANDDYEPALLEIIEALQAGKLQQAIELASAHLTEFPKSQLGHFLKAEALTAVTLGLNRVGGESSIPSPNLDGLKHQIKNRWRHANQQESTTHDKFPSSLIDMGKHPFVVVADMPEGRLYLYQNIDNKPVLIRDYYMTVGAAGYGKNLEGDNKTPIGVYHINRYIEGRALPDLYGKGAFPVNYPNRYDRYLKRTGYGIWLHGTPSDTYARSPWASEGCFVLSNDDLLDVGQYVDADKRTPVILSDTIEWLSWSELKQRKSTYVSLLEQWVSDWESLDTESYITHYQQRDFNFESGDYASWKQRKKTINEAKTFVQVDIELLSLFAYPGEKGMFVVKFKQRYISDNYVGESIKEQYWKRNQYGNWRIIYEG
jgi:murein L,D-transpeptidase YafK